MCTGGFAIKMGGWIYAREHPPPQRCLSCYRVRWDLSDRTSTSSGSGCCRNFSDLSGFVVCGAFRKSSGWNPFPESGVWGPGDSPLLPTFPGAMLCLTPRTTLCNHLLPKRQTFQCEVNRCLPRRAHSPDSGSEGPQGSGAFNKNGGGTPHPQLGVGDCHLRLKIIPAHPH